MNENINAGPSPSDINSIPQRNEQPSLVYSTDCLKDYHRMLALNFKVKSKPDYTDQGLEASLIDEKGNIIRLVEKRNYLEN